MQATKTRILIVLLGSTLLGSGCQDSTQQAQSSHEWEYLIKDSKMDGWSKKGEIEIENEGNEVPLISHNGGWLIYDQAYEDFTFEVGFLLGEKSNSAIAFRYNEEQKGSPAYNGYKVMLDHNLDQQNIMGSIYNVARAKSLKSSKPNQWNRLSIVAAGDHLSVMINDTLVVETHNRRIDEGLIGLEVVAGGTIKLKDMRIRELEEQEMKQPLIEDYMRNYSKRPLEQLIGEKELNDWRQVGEASWSIDDGVIHGYSNEKGGFLVYKNAYRNFYLKLKFKIIHEDNSGIFIRHNPAEPDLVSTDNAIECNIYDHDGYLHEFSTGAIVPFARSWSKMIDYDDWNDMEIFAFDDQICMYVNGIKSSEAHIPKNFDQKGEICIQGGIQVFNGNLPSDIYIKDMYVKNFDDIPYLGF